MNRRVDLSVLPSDLAELYATPPSASTRRDAENHAGQHRGSDPQLALPGEPAEHEFRRWLEKQPQPAFITEAAP